MKKTNKPKVVLTPELLAEVLLNLTQKTQRKDWEEYKTRVTKVILRNTLVKQYKAWSLSHTPTWETDNLIGNLLGWPKDYKGLYKNSTCGSYLFKREVLK